MTTSILRRKFLGAVTAAMLPRIQGQVLQREDDDTVYQQADWFQLRRQIRPDSKPLHRGAVAAAFHRVREAERLLEPLLRSGSKTTESGQNDSVEAADQLINLRMRVGKFQAALDAAEAGLRLAPGREDFQNARELLVGLSQFPEMTVRRLRPTVLRYADGGIGGEITINGKKATYFWDTGADLSITTESEVQRCGMQKLASQAKIGNSAGGQVPIQIALAKRIELGECVLDNVPFLVVRDDQQPFDSVAQEERGGIGLPVHLALGGFRWKPAGETEIGFRRDTRSGKEPNLCFNGVNPVTEFRFRGLPLTGHLDSGAVDTDIWPAFARRFPDVLEGARRERRTIGGVGQNAEFDAAILDKIALEVGDFPVTLSDADVYLEKIHAASERYYANIGDDVLQQAGRVTVDFQRLRLELEP